MTGREPTWTHPELVCAVTNLEHVARFAWDWDDAGVMSFTVSIEEAGIPEQCSAREGRWHLLHRAERVKNHVSSLPLPYSIQGWSIDFTMATHDAGEFIGCEATFIMNEEREA